MRRLRVEGSRFRANGPVVNLCNLQGTSSNIATTLRLEGLLMDCVTKHPDDVVGAGLRPAPTGRPRP